MSESPALLHNMSVPPKSVVRYSGLASLARQSGPGGSGACSLGYANARLHGAAVRFVLAADLDVSSPLALITSLGLRYDSAEHGPETRFLQQRINKRASELSLPEGCAVLKSHPAHPVIWTDPLAALAILTKCTDTVWLRGKTPSLSPLNERRDVSLLVPPAFTAQLQEAKG